MLHHYYMTNSDLPLWWAIAIVGNLTSMFVHQWKYYKATQERQLTMSREVERRLETKIECLCDTVFALVRKIDTLSVRVKMLSATTSTEDLFVPQLQDACTHLQPLTGLEEEEPKKSEEYRPTSCNDDDDEMLNDCYHALPLNNATKYTALDWFIRR